MSNLSNEDQRLITAYLQNELTNQESDAFNHRLGTSSEFKYAVEQQQALIALIPLGREEAIEEQRLQSLRWQTRSAISRSTRHMGFIQWLNQGLNFNVTLKVQLASMMLMFWLGFQLSPAALESPLEGELVAENDRVESTNGHHGAKASLLPVSLIDKEDFEITDLRIHELDLNKKTISFDYSVASSSRLSGNIDDKNIKVLLASAIKNHVSDATRIDLVELSKYQQPSSAITSALSYSLLNDPNPGVRMAAAETLGKITQSEDVKQVLISALQKEVNPGIRLEAFNALSTYKADEDLTALFRVMSKTDSNLYIKQQSNQLLQQSNKI
jgi:hypothetical protein